MTVSRPLLVRTLALGLATGGRSSLAIGAPLVTSHEVAHTINRRVMAMLVVGGELIADKLPGTPSRLAAAPLTARLVAGAVGGTLLARRASTGPALPALLGTTGAAAGTYAGAQLRTWASARRYGWLAALAEDLGWSALAVWAARSR